MKHLLYLFFISLSVISCKNSDKKLDVITSKGDTLPITYANGFSIVNYDGYTLLTVNSPWPEAEKNFTYALVKNGVTLPKHLSYDQKVTIPIKRIVVTSTTNIPSLETLGETNTLVGFPNLDYISSKETRKRIDNGNVQELGANEAINTEVLLALKPDTVIGFSIDGQNKTFNTIEKNGIPVLYNADWLEADPLGKAEWLKFFGALYDKQDLATQKFNEIVKAYLDTKLLAKNATNKPTVLSGAMYKDVWYLPYGDSWQAQFITDAYGDYLYKDTSGKGSVALAFEKVLDKAQDADIWIAPGSFTSYQAMTDATPHYDEFKAFKNKKIFTFAGVTGDTGGVLFYELGPNRPDLILMDLVKSLHPTLLPEYEPTFLKPLK